MKDVQAFYQIHWYHSTLVKKYQLVWRLAGHNWMIFDDEYSTGSLISNFDIVKEFTRVIKVYYSNMLLDQTHFLYEYRSISKEKKKYFIFQFDTRYCTAFLPQDGF